MEFGDGALVQLRAYIAQSNFKSNDQLPPERRLCAALGVSRTELRKAFAILEAEGTIWRHVGRGTFVSDGAPLAAVPSISTIAKRTTPREVMQARLLLEPMLAGMAADYATLELMDALEATAEKTKQTNTWREYESLDNHFHRLIAEATQNTPLLAMFDQLNSLRRTVVWGRLRQRTEAPPKDHHSFEEHREILDAIKYRDSEAARKGMHRHLLSVTQKLFPA